VSLDPVARPQEVVLPTLYLPGAADICTGMGALSARAAVGDVSDQPNV
jgi:hypothetical protein